MAGVRACAGWVTVRRAKYAAKCRCSTCRPVAPPAQARTHSPGGCEVAATANGKTEIWFKMLRLQGNGGASDGPATPTGRTQRARGREAMLSEWLAIVVGLVCLALLIGVLWVRWRWLAECRRAEARLKERERRE